MGEEARRQKAAPGIAGKPYIHCADRVAVLMDNEKEILGQADGIRKKISEERGGMFRPDVCDAFIAAARREYFWLDAVSPTVYRILRLENQDEIVDLDISQLRELAVFFAAHHRFPKQVHRDAFSRRGRHRRSVGRLAGFSKHEREYMRIAGLLHDLGKTRRAARNIGKTGKT